MPSGFYITTSRKPSVLSRRLVRWFKVLFGGETENRGKRSVRELAARAEDRGYSHILIVHEDHGNPSQLCFLEGWQTLAYLNMRQVALPEHSVEGERKGFGGLRRTVKASGEVGKLVEGLLKAGMKPGDMFSVKHLEIKVSDALLEFHLNGNLVGPKITLRSIHLVPEEERSNQEEE
jgi:hypothetical protein